MAALGITASQLEHLSQLSVDTAAAGKRMKVLGQDPRLEPQIGHQVLEEGALPPVSEVSRDSVFASSPPALLGRTSSTPVTAPSTTNAVPSTKDTTPDTDGRLGGLLGPKQATPSSDTSRRLLTLSRRAHLGTPILLSNNDGQFVHPIPWIPDSKSPQSRDVRPSYQPVRCSLEPLSKGSILQAPATPKEEESCLAVPERVVAQ